MSETSAPTAVAAEDADVIAMRRLAQGQDAALNEIMHRWKAKLASYLYRMTSSADVAADLTQETFVRLYHSRSKYEPTAAFSTYLFHIATNLARNHARWRSRHPSLSIEELVQPLPQQVSLQPSPDEALQLREMQTRVESALALIHPSLREPLHLFLYEGMGHSDIAKILCCSEKAVETRIYRARQLLRSSLADVLSA